MSIRVAAMLAAVTLPGLALAATEPHGEASGGMPQLAFDNPLIVAQVVWLLVIFGLLYFIMANYALPRIGAVLEQRRRTVEADLDAAMASKASADAAMAEYQAANAKARSEAQASVAAALQQAQDDATRQSEALNARLATQVAEAEARIAKAREGAMGALRQVSADTGEALVRRLAGTADRAAIERAVDRELAARGRA